MSKECPNCHSTGLGKFCTRCGTEKIDSPYCNWCLCQELWPRMEFCPGCGRTRHEATTAFPPWNFRYFFTKILNWLFDNKPTQNVVK